MDRLIREERERQRQPVLCFEEDLDAGIAAGRELNARGFARMPDGYWMVSAAHAERLQAQIAHIKNRLSKDLDGGYAAVCILEKLLPGGAK
jgi:hypothetical protein